jgi:outer membrane lipoprotein-sorting protein
VTLHVVVLEKKISTLIKDSYRNISDMSGDFTCSSSGEEDEKVPIYQRPGHLYWISNHFKNI